MRCRLSSARLPLLVVPAALVLLSCPDIGWAERKPTKITPKKLSERLRDPEMQAHHGSASLPADTSVFGRWAVLEGSLDLATGSRFDGELWVINGNLILGGLASVSGDINIVNGDLFRSRDATVTGHVRRYRCACRLDGDRYRKEQTVVFVDVKDPKALPVKASIGLGPTNRVDFSSLYAGVQRGNPDDPRPHWRGHAHMIAPFRSNTRGYLGFDLDLLIPVAGERADLHIQGFKKTVTNDDWQYSIEENSWALELSHNDFFDYYERSGGQVGLIVRPARSWSVDGHFYRDHSQSLMAQSAAALLNNGPALRDNPAVDRGEILGAVLGCQFDTRLFPSRPVNAWFVRVGVEGGVDAGPGHFGFTTVTVDARRYNRLLRGLNLDLRGRLFTTPDNLPRQRWQSLNGYGGVRGLRDIPFPDRRGDRLALFSTELRVAMPQLPILRILYTSWHLMSFADIGILRQHGDRRGALEFLKTPLPDWRKSIGLGISGESFVPYLGFYVAQDLDRHNKHPRFIVRVARSF